MNIPTMPWYGAFESALAPIQPYIKIALLLLALATAAVAIWGDAIVSMALFIYLVSP
jgi:hypothetical protein